MPTLTPPPLTPPKASLPARNTLLPQRIPAGSTDLVERQALGNETREWLITPRQCPALGKLGIFLAGWSEARAGFDFVRPHFPMSQLLFCTDGGGEVLIEGRWQACGPGQAYLTPPQVPHAYRALSGQTWSICWLTYRTQIVDLPRPLLVGANAHLMSFLLRQLRAEAMGANDAQALESWANLVQTQVERQVRAARAILPPTDQKAWALANDGRAVQERLMHLWEQVALHPQHHWDVAHLAGALGVSGEHLRRLCQQELGCSPMQQVTRIRVAHAATLLTHGRYTLSEIADQVGYSNSFVLSNIFYRLMGIRPSQYAAIKAGEKAACLPTSQSRESISIQNAL